MCANAVARQVSREAQPDGRIRFWSEVLDTRDGKWRMLRVVTPVDAQTLHNAFFDRGFTKDRP